MGPWWRVTSLNRDAGVAQSLDVRIVMMADRIMKMVSELSRSNME